MHVRDLLDQKPATLITVRPSAELAAAVRLLIAHHIGGLPVVDDGGALVGFVAERDVVRAIHDRVYSYDRLHVRDVMREAPTCDADDTVDEAMWRMTAQRQRHLLVTEAGTLVGVISLGDLVKSRLEQLEMEAGVLRDYVAGQRATRR
jgi:CBS domain-containing protein